MQGFSFNAEGEGNPKHDTGEILNLTTEVKTPSVTGNPRQGLKEPAFVGERKRRKPVKLVRSCEGCRQRKIICDSTETDPSPCTPCQQLKLNCVLSARLTHHGFDSSRALRNDQGAESSQQVGFTQLSFAPTPGTAEVKDSVFQITPPPSPKVTEIDNEPSLTESQSFEVAPKGSKANILEHENETSPMSDAGVSSSSPRLHPTLESKRSTHSRAAYNHRHQSPQTIPSEWNEAMGDAQAQSREIYIFTIVTIIFLPISFATSMFGMNMYESEHTQSLVSRMMNINQQFLAYWVGSFALGYLYCKYRGILKQANDKGARDGGSWQMWLFLWLGIATLLLSALQTIFSMSSMSADPLDTKSYKRNALTYSGTAISVVVFSLAYWSYWAASGRSTRFSLEVHNGLFVGDTYRSRLRDNNLVDSDTFKWFGRSSKVSISLPSGEVQLRGARAARDSEAGKRNGLQPDVDDDGDDEKSLTLRRSIIRRESLSFTMAVIWLTWSSVWASRVLSGCLPPHGPSGENTGQGYHHAIVSISGLSWGAVTSHRARTIGWFTAILSSWVAHWYVGDICDTKTSIDLTNVMCLIVTPVFLHRWIVGALNGDVDISWVTNTSTTLVSGGTVLALLVFSSFMGGQFDQRVKSWLYSCLILGLGGLWAKLLSHWIGKNPEGLASTEPMPATDRTLEDSSVDFWTPHQPFERLELLSHIWTAPWIVLFYRMLEPRLRIDHVRIRFKCACGVRIWDDYPFSLNSEVLEMQRKLDSFFRQVESNAAAQEKSNRFLSLIFQIRRDLKDFSNSLRRWVHRQTQGPRVDDEPQPPENRPPAAQVMPHYLTCHPEPGDRRPRLVQVPAAEIQGDRDYFNMLRKQARKIQRPWTRVLIPRKVKALTYVQMHLLHDNEHVDVLRSLEPQFPKSEDEYSPVDSQLKQSECLYLGSNTLLHFFESEKDCCRYPHALYAIPKKLKGKLSVPPQGRPMVGWGMQLADGVDTFRLGLSGFAGLLVSSGAGIAWARVHQDVQGGSGIAQCLMYFVTFLVTMHGVAEIR